MLQRRSAKLWSSGKRTLEKMPDEGGWFSGTFRFQMETKSKSTALRAVSPKWVSRKAAMFPSSFVSSWRFFQTGWAVEEEPGAGLVGFSGAILPSRGSSFRKAKIVSVNSPEI